ncbi:MAG: (E)-4-hydroxy-3-methylbut-2-enyl-diphosphate synthase [Puniceicoccales bacterium]|jgi:(E)-4-hydroxy-3-methylbut-2-enyl-diphosphate synthase|nr:(E)-4-hydroxy-3-methylbut-2-enyl-diphosphate synthase [Puniceicoccales bacterium]
MALTSLDNEVVEVSVIPCKVLMKFSMDFIYPAHTAARNFTLFREVLLINFPLMFRRQSRVVSIANLLIGGPHPIRVQSMTHTPTQDIKATVDQIYQLYEAQCEIIRIAVPNLSTVDAFRQIKMQLRNDQIAIPLVADVHFSPSVAIACIPHADKIRINPGNFNDNFSAFQQLVQLAKKEGKALRIGVNQGSLSKSILKQYGHAAEGMYQSVQPFLEIVQSENFENIVLSFKSNDVSKMIENHRTIVPRLDQQGFNFPLHIGVTEAGNDNYGRIKGAIGIGSLLIDGIGDTIRVSLTEDPVQEVAVAYDILQTCGKRFVHPEYIACPSCGRTQYSMRQVFDEIKAKTSHLSGIKIAIMGCVVNGIGEMEDADYGCVGAGPGKVNLYYKNHCVKTNISEQNAAEELIKMIETHETFLPSIEYP